MPAILKYIIECLIGIIAIFLTLGILLFKEFGAAHIDWPLFYNELSVWTGAACCIAFVGSAAYLVQAKRPRRGGEGKKSCGRGLLGDMGMGRKAEYKYM